MDNDSCTGSSSSQHLARNAQHVNVFDTSNLEGVGSYNFPVAFDFKFAHRLLIERSHRCKDRDHSKHVTYEGRVDESIFE